MKIGDRVKHKPTGREMEVVGFNGPRVVCRWYDEATRAYKVDNFSVRELESYGEKRDRGKKQEITDQEIRAAILEVAHDAGGPVNVLRKSEDWGVKKEKILAILNALRKEGLLKSRIIGLGRGRGMVDTMWNEITAKGTDEYERTHGIDKDK